MVDSALAIGTTKIRRENDCLNLILHHVNGKIKWKRIKFIRMYAKGAPTRGMVRDSTSAKLIKGAAKLLDWRRHSTRSFFFPNMNMLLHYPGFSLLLDCQ